MTDHQRLLKALPQYHSIAWINQYFNLVKRLFQDLQIENEDRRLAFTFNDNYNDINLNFGNRYILQPCHEEAIRCIVPSNFAEEAVGGEVHYVFSANTTRDAKWIQVQYPLGTALPPELYNAITEASTDRLRRFKSSPYRKDHSSLLYDFTIEKAVRDEISRESKKTNVQLENQNLNNPIT